MQLLGQVLQVFFPFAFFFLFTSGGGQKFFRLRLRCVQVAGCLDLIEQRQLAFDVLEPLCLPAKPLTVRNAELLHKVLEVLVQPVQLVLHGKDEDHEFPGA